MRTFSASVIESGERGVVLDQTGFNPRGGGLVSDTGAINGHRVLEATKEGDSIFHMLADLARLQSGEQVKGEIDWDRRYRVMRMHTTAHLLSSVVNGETGALITGNQISPDESRVDFNLERFSKELMTVFVDKVNEIARRGLEVKTYFLKRDEALSVPGLVKLANAAPPSVDELRIVQIGDVDTQADGGVHVRNTGEIGRVVGLRVDNKGKNNRRLYFTVS